MPEFSSLMITLKADIRNLAAGLKQAQSAVSAFGAGAAKHAGAASKAFFQFAERTGTKLNQVGTSMMSAGKNMTFMGAAITASVGVGLRAFSKYESGLGKIASLLGDNRERMGEVQDMLEGIATTSGTSLGQLTDAYFDVQSAVGDVTKSMDIMTAADRLAVAGRAELTSTTSGLVTLMEAYGGQLKDASDGADLLYIAQVKARASIDELAQSSGMFLPLASDLGVKAEDAFAAFSKMTVSMGNVDRAATSMTGVLSGLLKPTDELQKKSEEWYGTTIQQAVAEGKFLDILRRLGEVEKEEVGRMLPRVQGMRGLLAVSKDFNKVVADSAEFQKRAGITAKEYEKAMGELSQVAKVVWQNLHLLLIEVIKPMVPAIKEFATKTLPPLIDKFKAWAEEHPKLVKYIGLAIAAIGALVTILGVLGVALGAAIKGLGFIFTALSKIPTIIGAVKTGLTTLCSVIKFLIVGFKALAVAMGISSAALLAWVALIAVAVAAIAGIVIAYKKWKDAHDAMQKSLADGNRRMTDNMQKSIEYHDKLRATYDNITEAEKRMLDANDEQMRGLIKRMLQVELNIQQGKITREEAQKEIDAIQRKVRELQNESVEISNAIEKRHQEAEAAKKSVEVKTKEAEIDRSQAAMMKDKNLALEELGKRQRAYNEELAKGQITSEEYAQKFVQLREQFIGIVGDAKLVDEAMAEVDQSDPNIQMKLEVFGMEKLEDLEEEVIRMNQELVLSQLDGDARREQSLKFNHENEMRRIAKRRETQKAALDAGIIELTVAMEKEIAVMMQGYDQMDAAQRASVDRRVAAKRAEVADVIAGEREKYEKSVAFFEQMESISNATTQNELGNLQKRGDGYGGLESKVRSTTGAYNEQAQAVDRVAQAEQRRTQVLVSRGSLSGGGGGGGTYISGGSTLGTISSKITTGLTPTPAFKAPTFTAPVLSSRLGSRTSTSRYVSSTPFGSEAWRSAQGGMPFVPSSGLYALHKGERVVPRGQNERGGGQGEVTVVNLIDPSMINELLDKNVVVNIINSDIIQRGITRRVIKGVVSGG